MTVAPVVEIFSKVFKNKVGLILSLALNTNWGNNVIQFLKIGKSLASFNYPNHELLFRQPQNQFDSFQMVWHSKYIWIYVNTTIQQDCHYNAVYCISKDDLKTGLMSFSLLITIEVQILILFNKGTNVLKKIYLLFL